MEEWVCMLTIRPAKKIEKNTNQQQGKEEIEKDVHTSHTINRQTH
jgi:hypothetical protein